MPFTRAVRSEGDIRAPAPRRVRHHRPPAHGRLRVDGSDLERAGSGLTGTRRPRRPAPRLSSRHDRDRHRRPDGPSRPAALAGGNAAPPDRGRAQSLHPAGAEPITDLLLQASGDDSAALDRLLPVVYDRLRADRRRRVTGCLRCPGRRGASDQNVVKGPSSNSIAPKGLKTILVPAVLPPQKMPFRVTLLPLPGQENTGEPLSPGACPMFARS
jgi:hypothetical protein